MNKFVTGAVVVLGMVGSLGWGTTAQAKTQWTAGSPKQLRGAWVQLRVKHIGTDTDVSANALMLAKDSVTVMTGFGDQAYGGKHLAYHVKRGTYYLRDYFDVEKTWNYTKITRHGKKLTLQEYGKRKPGKPFQQVTAKAVHLKYNAKASAVLLK
ncbi:hypothetical protein [Levilactobacillus enshiensis]|uniref:hypothetical protein n=1 Tax=Levilactobacillus enshiensis TaxID=2590213 RepID=UPI00117BC173|nr:hypothetical protein [Levilactobacillus enshiensis]